MSLIMLSAPPPVASAKFSLGMAVLPLSPTAPCSVASVCITPVASPTLRLGSKLPGMSSLVQAQAVAAAIISMVIVFLSIFGCC